MKKKNFTLLIAVIASLGKIFAVTIDGIEYNLNYTYNTAGVIQGGSYSGDIVIPESIVYGSTFSVTSIEYGAFSDCEGLTSVAIPNSVTSVGDNAFSNCYGLTSIINNATIPQTIDSYVFDEVDLSSCILYVPSQSLTTYQTADVWKNFGSIQPIDDSPAQCIIASGTCGGDLAWELNCDSVLTISGTGRMRNFNSGTMPWSSYRETIKSLIIEDSVTSIGSYAFSYCSGLTSVTIGNSVTSIESRAFEGCSSLTSIEIPISVTLIGDMAFRDCYRLASVHISDIAAWCNISFVYQYSNPLFYANKLYLNGELVTDLTIPNSVTNIRDGAFSRCSSLTSVTIPNIVTNIGSSAFYDCHNLTSVTIGNSVTNIGEGAFAYCTGLTSIEIPNSVTSIRSSAFDHSGLTSVTIGNSVTVIWSDAFSDCADLTTVTINSNTLLSKTYYSYENLKNIFGSQVNKYIIGDNVTSIGDYAFYNCTSLTSVVIPNSVTSIGEHVFQGCTSLTSPIYNIHVFAFLPSTYSGAYTIPEGIETIIGNAFKGCTCLTSITIPISVTSIGNNAFFNCTGLTSVTAPVSIFDIVEQNWSYYTRSLQSVTFTGGELNYNVLGILSRSYKTLISLDISGISNTELNDESFKGFYNLQSLVLPSNSTKIGYMAVAECVKLQSIDIPAGVTEIDDRAFENCRSLKTITFGGSANPAPGRRNTQMASESQLERIGNWAFYNCHELQNLEIPEGVTEIGDGAFYGCVYMEDLSLPASVQTIGDNTFALCAKIQKMVVNAPVPPSIQTKTFYDVKRQIPVYVPNNSVSSYLNDSQWREFNIQGISNMPTAIDKTTDDQQLTTKILHNGQLFILRDEQIFNAQGARVK